MDWGLNEQGGEGGRGGWKRVSVRVGGGCYDDGGKEGVGGGGGLL